MQLAVNRSELLEHYIGHKPGGVCPFAVKPDVTVYLDVSLKRFQTVYPAAGDDHSAIELSPKELETYSPAADWVDVCSGWLTAENQEDGSAEYEMLCC